MGTFFTVLSNLKSTQLNRKKETDSSLSAISTNELPYHWLVKIPGSPTVVPYHYALILNSQIFKTFRQDLRDHNLLVNKMNKSLLYPIITRNRELNKLAQITTELKIEKALKNC